MQNIISCYIIDDERDSREVIKKFVEMIPFLTVCGESGNPVEALFEIQKLHPDLLFLDVQMPKIGGFEFIRSLSGTKPQIIMVTAFAQFALEGFEHQVLDYLLKPVSFERFLKAIGRLERHVDTEKEVIRAQTTKNDLISNLAEIELDNLTARKPAQEFILVKQGTKLVRVEINEIIYIESMKDYMKIYLKQRMVVAHGTLTKMAELLPSDRFLRISRSYIIKESAIMEIDGNEITIENGKKIDIGITYREVVQVFMNTHKK
ncbi:response regulator [Dyadobacter sp. CY345]|uniref:LytR/AlgR family response regulator transcription factor n=1 Tax=Dyadobacter sp. CY345 TaxID=2909335 RepID=UPI001F3498FF|nr:response regulator [Dyadobacter sp. CY345]MCF2446951.1 response regulator [Dyadobacter sp. CY345]